MTDQYMGFLNVNKPLDYTSHDIVARVRRRYRELTGSKKVGHAGTLDPRATGVLILCLGSATRLSDYVMHTTKTYRAQITLGKVTDTYDAEGEFVEENDASHVNLADIEAILPQFAGNIQQIPPMYSAIKIDGKKLYDLAREGKTIKRKPRDVTISNLTIIEWVNPTVTLDVVCSSGTYIRSLAYDIGQALNVGAYLSGLERSASGNFDVSDSISLDTIMSDDSWHEQIIRPHTVLQHLQSVILNDDQITSVQQGKFIPRLSEQSEEFVFAFTPDQQLVAILTPRNNMWKPHKVFLRQT